MNKFPIDKKYLTISIYVFLVIAAAILFEKAIGSVGEIAGAVSGVAGAVAALLAPFLYGLVVAYTLNAGVKSLEKNVLSRIPKVRERPGLKRMLAIAVCYVVLLGCLTWVITYMVPEISKNVQNLAQTAMNQLNGGALMANVSSDGLVGDVVRWVNETFSSDYTTQDVVNAVREPALKMLSSIPQFLSALYAGTVKAAYTLLNFCIGLIIAFYMLCEKENFGKLATKILYAALKKDRAERVIAAGRGANRTFEQFLIGKVIDSLIVGILFFVICAVLGVRYALLLSLIIGVTNMIPFFGPFIGGVPAVLIVMSYDVPMGLWMILIIFILQQFDGNVLGPKILGDSLGLKPIGIIFAIFIGGWVAGVAGMFFGVPLFAVLSVMFKGYIDRKYAERGGEDPPPPEPPAPPKPPQPPQSVEADHTFEYSYRHKKGEDH